MECYSHNYITLYGCGMGYITLIIMLHYLRLHPASRIALSHFPAGFEEASRNMANCLWRGPCGKELRWPLEAEDSLGQTASRNLWSSWPYNCKEINSASNLRGFGSRFFFSQASRWEHSPADTFNVAWGNLKVETLTKLCPDFLPTETEIINACGFKPVSL